MNVTILGGGLSALSLALFIQNKDGIERIDIIEKEERAGGLCRSFNANGIEYDVGPHIFFSKDTEALQVMLDLLGSNAAQIRRSNRILHKGIFVQYPFENGLSKLPQGDRDYCVNTFLNNPYENYNAENILQFFLKIFGEGITNTYLRPYNEKIWKFDPSFMDTQMVERIPKPPKEDILRSAAGETVDGYTHQLYFSYPKAGGTESLIKALLMNLNRKVRIHCNAEVRRVEKRGHDFKIVTGTGEFECNRLVSTIPLDRFTALFENPKPVEVTTAANALKHNSIAIAVVNVNSDDRAGGNFAFMTADKEVCFHRLSKLDFLGDHYHIDNSTSYMVEVTYRKGDITDCMSDEVLIENIITGLKKIHFISSDKDINFTSIRRFDYAYIIYDLEHRKNVDIIKNYFLSEGVVLNGRFGSFEYLNMDAVVRRSMELAKTF